MWWYLAVGTALYLWYLNYGAPGSSTPPPPSDGSTPPADPLSSTPLPSAPLSFPDAWLPSTQIGIGYVPAIWGGTGQVFDLGDPMTTDLAGATSGVRELANAIASAEGYGVPGAIPTRANNPGDLVIPNWPGASLGSEGISVFDSVDQGWQRLYRQLNLIVTGRSHVYTIDMSIAAMAAKWTATTPSDWAQNVAVYLQAHGYPDVTVDSALAEVLTT